MSTEITDFAPVGIVDDRDILFTTLRSGQLAATLSAIDTGPLTGGRWFIDSQSRPGLFSIAYNPAVDTAARLLVNDASLLPEAGVGVSVTVHYYDRYQLDGSGNPLAGRGIAETLVYTVEAGTSHELDGFGADFTLGSAGAGSPALASLAGGGFAAVWQGPGGALRAQVRDAAGIASGAAFTLAAQGAAPAVAALGDGRFAVAYTTDAGIAWRSAGADGSLGPEHLAVSRGSDTAMSDLVALGDGSLAIAWRAGGQVHVQQVDAGGSTIGAEKVFGTLGSAFSPSLTALGSGYAVSWGEIGDGNVYAALPGGATVQVSSDGLAASVSTAAPLPEIVALADGSFVVAWDSYTNSPFGFAISDIFFQRFDAAGAPLGAVTQANVDSGGGRFAARLSAFDDGSFMLAWQAEGGDFDANGVFGRRFDAGGNALDLREFGINEARAGDQASPALTALAHGGFAAAWIDTQDDGVAQVEARVLAGTPPASGGGAGSGAQTGTPPDGGVGLPPPAVPGPMVPDPAVPPPVVPDPIVPAPAPAPVIPAPVPATPAPAPAPAPSVPPVAATPPPPVLAPVPKVEVSGHAGADLIRAGSGAGNQRIDALDGLDTVSYAGAKAGFTLQRGVDGVSVADKAGASDLLVNVERIAFTDVAVALDIDGAAGQAYRLYAAAFDRAPDKAGLGYWIGMMDAGAGLRQVAAAFAASSEFAHLYGTTTSDSRFVELLYDNVLHRAAEGAGRDFWVASLSVHGVSRAEVLAQFSESAENQAQVIAAIRDGIDYLPWA